jgi:hypothetical protein
MNTSRRPLRLLGLAATLTLAACTATTLTACTAPAAPAKLSPTDSPLFAVFGPLAGFGDDEATRAKQRKVEELTAKCMAAEGFQYTPTDSAVGTSSDELAAQQTEEWVAKNGYGLSAAGDTAGDTDPNQKYIDGLSTSEQDAYYRALHGTGTLTEDGDTSVSTTDAFDPETAGCSAKAQREANGGKGNFWEDEKYAGLLEKTSKLYEDREKAPEVVAAAKKWSACMAEAGHSGLATKSDALQRASEKNAELYGVEDGEVSSEDKQPTAAEKKKARDAEIALALADLRCDKKTGYSDAQLKAQFALEEKFVRENRAKLDELVDTYGDKR